MIIKTLKSNRRSKGRRNIKKYSKKIFGPGKKPFLNKTDKTIRYMEQRHRFFNPSKEMLSFIIDVNKKSNLDRGLFEKMKEDLLTKV